ncbi:MAG: DeoR/GlpR family DNA-binding transcription regulator [Candidatus Velthaea sp.]|jgi:DeoR/GlpR family transcriptional regulator of sugar metabolism
MIGTERLKEIVALVERHGLVRTFELSESFGVTLSTVRRDLEVLEGEGLLRRVHGGAVSLRGRGYESPYPTRSVSNIDGKRAIARKAASFVSEGASIALDVGSTALQLAFELKAHRHLTVVTNNLRAAVELAEEPSHRVLVTGGLLRYGELSVVGHLAERVYTEFFVDQLFLGAAGVAAREGVTDFNIEEALVKKCMLAQAKERFLLVDQTKFERVVLTQVCALGQINRLVTDALPPPELRRQLQEAGVEVIVAD